MTKGKLHTFAIDHTSSMDGEKYQGSFTCKKMTIIDQTRVSRRKSELCGGMFCVRDEEGNPTGQGIDEWSEVQSRMIAILEVAIVQKPIWWNLDEIYDEELTSKVFEEVIGFENSFRRRTDGPENQSQNSNGSSEGSSQEQHSPANVDSNAPKVVDGQVSSALDA